MGRRRVGFLCALAVLAVAVGCTASPRLVKWDQAGGVLAIPSNSDYWPSYYRSKAETLMSQKCPSGFVIEKEEEVVVGQHQHTVRNTDSQAPPVVSFGGEEESSSRGKKSRSGAGLAVPLGETHETTNQTTTVHDVTEYRIWFRPK
jgi:hypothetical protein